MKEFYTSVAGLVILISHTNNFTQLYSMEITKMIVRAEHLRLLHVGPTMLALSIGVRFHIEGGKKIIRDQGCLAGDTWLDLSLELWVNFPIERLTPGMIFEKVGIDYAGPIHVKYGYIGKLTSVKAYICVFV